MVIPLIGPKNIKIYLGFMLLFLLVLLSLVQSFAQSDNATIPESEAINLIQTLSNWGRWGSDDKLGLLNLLTTETRLAALSLVKKAELISLSRPVSFGVTEDGLPLPSGKASAPFYFIVLLFDHFIGGQ